MPSPLRATARYPKCVTMPIFERRCFGCHTGDGVAAEEHDFSHVEARRAARATIADEISTCPMPPRSPLDDREANTLLLWAACADRTPDTGTVRGAASFAAWVPNFKETDQCERRTF